MKKALLFLAVITLLLSLAFAVSAAEDYYVYSPIRTEGLLGDLNGDGEIGVVDCIFLSRAIANWEGYSFKNNVADINCNGEVDSLDAIVLARHLANLKGYETIPFVAFIPDITDSYDNTTVTKNLDVTKLTMSSGANNAIRVRQTSPNSRLLVNKENPVFLFNYPSGELPRKTKGQTYVATYNALPEDIRAFSIMQYDPDSYNSDKSVILKNIEDVLNETDKNNVPMLILLENWGSVSTRDGFTYEELATLLENHKSLMGFIHLEQACSSGEIKEQIKRIKTTVNACKDYNALFVWMELEYKHWTTTNYINRAFDDKELFDLFTEYSHNIIITDKHNGQGRHFSVQSSAMGSWLAGLCGNWGSNIEAWLWWEEGFGALNEMGTTPRNFEEKYILNYAPALGGIDTICDMVGGANVYSSEFLFIYDVRDGRIKFSETFWSVIYPLYQKILNGAVPDKQEVVDNVKVAYQFTSPTDELMRELESGLFIDTYGITSEFYNKYSKFDTTKKWIPYTGRYYIIPSIPKYAKPSSILPNTDILTNSNYKSKLGTTATSKTEYLNSKYEQTYIGNATLFTINGMTYILNNNENQTEVQKAQYNLSQSKLQLSVKISEHTYVTAKDNENGIDIEITNLRLDTDKVNNGSESMYEFVTSYLKGNKTDRQSDFRTTKITVSGLSKMPNIDVSGSNGAKATVSYSENKQTATITVISNGVVKLKLTK